MRPERPASPGQFANALSAVPGMIWPAVGSDQSAHLMSLLFQFEQSQWFSPARLRELQVHQLRLVLRHARDTVPYYASPLHDIDPRQLDWNDFTRLPLLSRAELQQGFDALSSRHPPSVHGMVTDGQSSGSTGMPVRYRGTAVTKLFWEALTLREHLWHRRDFGGRLAAIRVTVDEGYLPDWGLPAAQVFQTGPAMTLNAETDLPLQLEWLQRHVPDYLITHPSNLGALAELSIEKGIRLPGLRETRTSGEIVTAELRQRVRQAWGVPVSDMYSAAELGAMAFQCPDHEHYHVQSENLIIEILHPDGSDCGPGETGEVVVTTLHNFAMPLIRYRIGDFAEVGEACPCGRGLPVLRRIHGRQRNMITLPSGQRFWPSFPAALWRKVAPVQQFQLVQHRLDEIEARYVMSRDLGAEELQQLESALRERLRFPHRIRFVRVAVIERGASHKFEDFISLL